MAVIIGAGTVVTLSIASEGIISIDWSRSANIERLYTLGNGQGTCGPPEYATIKDSQISVNFSIYGGASSYLSTCAADSAGVCADSPTAVIVSVVPGVCDTQVTGLVDQKVFINNYSYSKDRVGHGTEQWGGTAYVQSSSTATGRYTKPIPSYVILGIAEGTIECEEATMTDAIQDLVGAWFATDSIVEVTERASVQAGQVGEQMFVHNGTFRRVGGSQFWDPDGSSGITAKTSVSLSLTPVYTGRTS